MDDNYISEIFSAIQGEGPFAGKRQIFIRLSGCDIRCIWCDTPQSLKRVKQCEIETGAGKRKFISRNNPLNKVDVVSYISKLSPEIHHSISITGGEPLLQNNALKKLLPELKKNFHLPIYLETGGHRPDKLKNIIKYIDFISMDFKLPSSSRTEPSWNKHSDFLSSSIKSKSLKSIWVKIVLTNKTSINELKKSIEIIKSFAQEREIEVFLQPVTKINGTKPPSEIELLDIHNKLLKLYPHIRVLPQTHKFLGQK